MYDNKIKPINAKHHRHHGPGNVLLNCCFFNLSTQVYFTCHLMMSSTSFSWKPSVSILLSLVITLMLSIPISISIGCQVILHIKQAHFQYSHRSITSMQVNRQVRSCSEVPNYNYSL